MKWIKLDGKKDPDFKSLYAIWIETPEESGWQKAKILRIETNQSGKKYTWISENDTTQWDNATHFATITPPNKDKEQ